MASAVSVPTLPRVVGLIEIIRCPGCRAQRYDDGTFCPECGEYANPEVRPNRDASLPRVRCSNCSLDATIYLYGRAVCHREGCRDLVRDWAILKMKRA